MEPQRAGNTELADRAADARLPALANSPPAGSTGLTQAEALLASGLILLILDGLDEIPEQARGPAITKINDALRPGEQLVVTSRTQHYRDAVRPDGGVEVTLRGAAAIQLRALDPDTVRGYLSDDTGGPVGRARWTPVSTVLGTEAPAAQALSTPLMVGLARTVYNPRPGEAAGALRDPAELLNPALADRTAVESLLFDAFIPAAYRQGSAVRWKTQDVERWLVFLARHLEHTITRSDLAWWQLPQALPGFGAAAGAVVGLLFGIASGVVAGVVSGVAVGACLGAVLGVVAGAATVRREPPKPVRGLRWRAPSRGNLVFGVACGVPLGVLVGVVIAMADLASGAHILVKSDPVTAWAIYGAWVGSVIGVAAAMVRRESPELIRGLRWRSPGHGKVVSEIASWVLLGGIFGALYGALGGGVVEMVIGTQAKTVTGVAGVFALGAGLGLWAGTIATVVAFTVDWVLHQRGAPLDLSSAATPTAVLAVDRRIGTAVGVLTGMLIGAAFWARLRSACGIAAGISAGIISSYVYAAWPSYVIARVWLASHHLLPWTLMRFLADAHKRGVLRQVGTVYQFRHIELQHRLASRDAEPTATGYSRVHHS